MNDCGKMNDCVKGTPTRGTYQNIVEPVKDPSLLDILEKCYINLIEINTGLNIIRTKIDNGLIEQTGESDGRSFVNLGIIESSSRIEEIIRIIKNQTINIHQLL